MNWDIIEGNWTQFKAAAREQWAKITDDEWEQVAAKKDRLAGIIQQHYGTKKDDVAKDVNVFLDKWKPENKPMTSPTSDRTRSQVRQ